jgi:hypothetical protein
VSSSDTPAPKHLAAHRADKTVAADRPGRRTTGGSHRSTHRPTHASPRARTGRKVVRTAAITSGLASVATAVAVGGGMLSAGTPVMDPVMNTAGDLAAAAAGPSIATMPALSADDLASRASRARVPVSRSDRRQAVDPDKAKTLAQPDGQAVTGTESLSAEDPRTIARALLAEFGFSADQFSCLDSLWTSESGWRVNADNPSSSAYGIPQALPGSKMSSFGADWATNPITQIRWGLDYISSRYGSPCSAWSFKAGRGWY